MDALWLVKLHSKHAWDTLFLTDLESNLVVSPQQIIIVDKLVSDKAM